MISRKGRLLLIAGIALLILVVGLGIFAVNLSANLSASTGPQGYAQQIKKLIFPGPTQSASAVVAAAERSAQDFQTQIQREASKVGQIDNNPTQTEARLKLMAVNLNNQQRAILKVTALDIQQNGDLRGFSAYLLALDSSSDAQANLIEILNAPLATGQTPELASFEETLRGMVMDGLLHSSDKEKSKAALGQCAENSPSAFLAERARQGIAFLNGGKQTPADIEHQSLRSLLTHH